MVKKEERRRERGERNYGQSQTVHRDGGEIEKIVQG